MKRRLFLTGLLFICVGIGYGQSPSGPEIIQKVNDLLNQKSVQAKMTMTIITSSGKERTFEYDSWSMDFGEKNLVRYVKPSRVKGQAILMRNNADDIWAYFPRTKRVRKLATHAKKQKMQGSDFTYEDMGSGDAFMTNFSTKRIADEKIEGHDCYKIELMRTKDSDSHYSRLVMWVRRSDFFPVVIDYYDEDDSSLWLKRLVQYNIQTIDGIPTGMKMIMYNKVDNTQTSSEILTCKYNVELDKSMFTERGLKK